jgi:hypothetical protein
VGEAREGGSDARVGTAIFFFAGREGDKWKNINGCFVMRSCLVLVIVDLYLYLLGHVNFLSSS